MATGDRRLGSSTRRGMTVLGKIPAVPKPINLPSQRLENRGLDPSVEIVPRGTFSWGTGRSPPTSGSSWGNVGLSSSPPVGTGAWNMASTSAPISSSNNSSGAQNLSRPLSAGSTRPSSAGTIRPLSATTMSGRAWGGAAKLEEQFQPSRFNLTTAEFPTLGSEKNPNLRPQQNPAPSNRPTSADATKERHLAYADHYQSGTPADRPTSADGSKDWKAVYPGLQHAARPTSADGAHSDKGGQQQALRLPVRPQFPDGRLPDQRHPFYTGVVGHGTAGPGPGTLDQPKDNFSNHPLPVQHGMAAQGREFVFPGASQHDPYFNRPGGPHGNDVVVLPLDARPEVYGSYAFDSRPNHPDMSRAHHPQPSWGPNHLERPGIHQGQFLQPGSAEHFHIMQPQRRRMETAVMHEQQPILGNRRDGFGINDKAFGEQRVGWGGTNVVYVGSSQDVRESSIPMSGTGPDFPRPNMFLSSWGHQPMHAGWGNMYGGDMTVGMYQEMPPSVVHQQAMVIEAMPQGSVIEGSSEKTILEKSNEKGTVHADEVVHASSAGGQPVVGHQAAASGNTPTVGQDVQHLKQEEAMKTSSVKIAAAGPDILRNRNNNWARGGLLAGNQALKTKQGGEGSRAEQNREAQKMNLSSNMGFQRQEDNSHGNSQSSNQDQVVANKDGNNGSGEEVKATPRKKILSSLQSTKGTKESDSSVNEREERTPFSKACEGTLNNLSNLSTADLSTTYSKEHENDWRDTCTDGFSQSSQNRQLKSSAKDLKVMSTPNCEVPVGAPVSEEEKVLFDDGTKIKRNGQFVRRAAHHGRSVNESHTVDRQHVNHGMVWAPKPMGAGATKEETQLPGGDTSDLHEAMQKASADVAKKRRMQQQPLREHESQGESQVQQMQSAVSSQQGQGQQVQEHSVVSSKRSVQQRAERSSKKQGHRAQQQQASSSVSQEPVQEEQPALINRKSQSLQMKPQQHVISSHVELAQPLSQVAAISQREALSRKNLPTEEAEKDGEVVGTPAPNKFDGKRNKEEGTVYMRKPARNQHRQQHEQAYEAVNNYHGQRSYPKEEKSVAEDLETPASETSAFSGTESRKNQKEVRSRSTRNTFKQQKGDRHEPATSLVSEEGHVASGDRPHLEVRGETRVPSLAAETKVVKDKEDSIHNQKLVRQQEMHINQSATGSHQEHRHFGEELKADVPSSESTTIRNEKKLYIPKQARKPYLQQEYEATNPHGQGRQQKIQEGRVTGEKGHYDGQGSQPSGIQTSTKKNDMERYTPVHARQPNMQGQQSATQGQRVQRTPDLTGGQATRASSVHAGSMSSLRESTRISDTKGKGDESQPCATGLRDERKMHEIAESGPSKKETKHYIVKSGGQHQQYPSNVDEEAPAKEEKWLKPHRPSATDSIKRKEGMQLYTPKHARQEETSVTLEENVSKEAVAEPSVAEQHDPGRNGKEERTREFDHSHKNRNHSTKGGKTPPLYHAQKRNQPPLEDRYEPQRTLEDSAYVSRVEETNGSMKEHKKNQESGIYQGIYQNVGSRRGHRDAMENPSFEDAEIPKPRQNQRRQYQYQAVSQHLSSVKLQAEDPNAHRPNTKQVDQGHSRYERREGSRRGRGQL